MTEQDIPSELYLSVVYKLNKYNLPIDLWGQDGKKEVDDLVRELAQGDCQLVETREGLLRKVLVVGVDLYHTDEQGQTWRLREDRQVFYKDGSVRRRDLGAAVQEKIKPHEEVLEAAIRGVLEELGKEVRREDVKLDNPQYNTSEPMESPSYPGLMSFYERVEFEGSLEAASFNPGGYIEEGAKKITYFVWKPID